MPKKLLGIVVFFLVYTPFIMIVTIVILQPIPHKTEANPTIPQTIFYHVALPDDIYVDQPPTPCLLNQLPTQDVTFDVGRENGAPTMHIQAAPNANGGYLCHMPYKDGHVGSFLVIVARE